MRFMVELRMVPHEVLRVAQGRVLIEQLVTGEQVLVRLAGSPMNPDGLAEPHALDQGLAIVPLTRDDINVVAHGRTVLVLGSASGAVGGTLLVQVRLFSAEELLAAHEQACRKMGMEPTFTLAQARELTRHL